MKKSLELSFTYDLDKGIDTHTITEAFQSFINTLERESVDYKLTATTTAFENDVKVDEHSKSCNWSRCVPIPEDKPDPTILHAEGCYCRFCTETPEATQDLGPNSSESWEIRKDECGVPLMPESVVTGIMHPIEFTDGEGARRVLMGDGNIIQSTRPKPWLVRKDLPVTVIHGHEEKAMATIDLFSDQTATMMLRPAYFNILKDSNVLELAIVSRENKPTADLLIPVQLVGKTFATKSAGHIKVWNDGTVEASISPEYANEFKNADYVSMALKRLGE